MVTSDLGACEWFVWDLRRSGLIDRGPLDQFVSEFLKRNPRAEAPALAEYLVDQGTLTTFQAERVLNGKSQGLVLGPYVLLDAIGSGSMGQVYKATSKNDNVHYAVKVLPRRSMWNVRLARRQVRSFASFSHPAVVPFVDVGTAGGLHYLAWPLVEGTTLDSVVQHHGKLPPNRATLYAVQVAQGLTLAHKNNLFHGLVKPSNIMIDSDNQARILDFGIGSLLVENEGESLVDTMSTANALTSGLDCASPESIMEPTNRTPAGDQYSLGCVLYYALTGHVPFSEGSAVEKLIAHQMKEPTPIRELVPDVPAGLEAVVKRLMAKTADGRFSGCDELVEALEPFLGDRNQLTGGSRGAAPGIENHSSGNTPAVAVRAKPGSRSTPPNSTALDSIASVHSPKLPSELLVVNTRTPNPQPPRVSVNVPNRASFNLLGASVDHDTGASANSPMPPEPARAALPKLPTRATSTGRPEPKPAPDPESQEEFDNGVAWAEEVQESKGNRGTIGLIATAALLMVGVYLVAAMLMK